MPGASAFRRGPKPEIAAALFDYCVQDFWNRRHRDESSLTLREIALGAGSPGQVFQLPEEDVRARLEARVTGHVPPYRYQASAVQGLVFRTDTKVDLSQVYQPELVHA